ncbi:unnamed protein product [Rotaria magnacalcarata]|uniref:Uncharacterized protein n=1 Tax=Rotaria magnacalcarata TaxID=392030 RepID=A0A815P601_9BILA|nr:unnamed protein product [Rotaria magnacalcarata]
MMTYRTNELNALPNEELSIGIQSITFIGLSYVKEYNSQNLLGIYDAGNYGRFATKVMKILFSSTEMSQSIIYSNSVCAKSMLDPDHAMR